MRRRDPLPPEVARGLDDLDAALAAEPGADPDLLALAADVRAAREEPDAAFLASLDARVHAGFPRPERRARRWRPWMPAMGLAATALVALVVVVSTADLGGSGGDGASSSSSGGGSSAQVESSGGSGAAADSAAPESAASAPSAAAPAPAPARAVAPGRKVERGVTLTLSAKPGDVQEVADGVVRDTQAVGGYVQSSQVSTADGGGSATFTLRVPSARLDDALARYPKLAHVASMTQGTTDITAPFTSAQERLSDARAERRALLRALGRATTGRQVAALRARLRANRSEIAQRKGEVESLRRRADLATVELTVEGTAKADEGGGAWTPRDALGDAGRVLEVAAGIALVGLAVLAPLALLALLVGLAARASRRHRREAALDGAN